MTPAGTSFFVFVFLFLLSWSLVDVPLIFFCPADHVPDWQPRVLLGMVEARSVNVKKTTTRPTNLMSRVNGKKTHTTHILRTYTVPTRYQVPVVFIGMLVQVYIVQSVLILL